MISKTKIADIYSKLFNAYGPQGWWPLVSHRGTNPTKSGAVKGYHVRDYSFPRNREEQFEICLGAILTQNTSWTQVEKAIINLHKLGAICPEKLLKLDENPLKTAIKSAGYFNQKAKKLKIFAGFFIQKNREKNTHPTREELLALWGIGPETADSILLYAYKHLSFVVDSYTKRIFTHLGILKKDAKYDEIQLLFEKNLPQKLEIYQEYHSLLVEHAKCHYRKKPYKDPLLD